MQIRDWVNNNSAVVTILAVVMLVISLGVIIMNSTGNRSGQITKMYYYNIQTGKFFVASSSELAPITTESGPDTGVRAYIYGCGECPSGLAGLTLDEARNQGVFVGYFEKFSPKAKAALLAEANDPEGGMLAFEALEQGQLFQIPGTDRWLPSNTMQGMEMRDQMVSRMQCPEGQSPKLCFPR